jgi:4-amino-4-deoxy-L-arabinose transferase-like glycosyltransferase
MALTSLTKGLLGFALPLVVIALYSFLADGWADLVAHLTRGRLAGRIRWGVGRNRWFFNWRTPLALALAAAIYYAPFAISHLTTGSDKGLSMVFRENVERFFKPFDHRGPIYLYTYVIFALMAPWSVFLPAALVNAHRRKANAADGPNDRFTLVYFWATFVFFTLSGSRRSYYLLPILPAAAMLVARALTAPAETLTPWTNRLLKAGFGVIVVAVAISTLAFLPPRMLLPQPWAELPTAPDLPIFAVYWLGSVCAIVYAMRNLTTARITLAAGTIAWLFLTYFFVFAMPAGDNWRGEKPFALEVRRIVADDASKLALFRTNDPVFYLDLPNPVPEYETPSGLTAAIAAGQVRWLIARRRDVDKLHLAAPVTLSETVYPWDPKEHRLNTMVLLRIAPSQ